MARKLKCEVRRSADKQFYAVLIARNGKTFTVGETTKRRVTLLRSCASVFKPFVDAGLLVIVDKTQ